jgi:hypothetical protein
VSSSGSVGVFLSFDSECCVLALTTLRGLFRAARSCLLRGIPIAVMVGWLCILVSGGVCSVTCGHSTLWPVIRVLTAGKAVVPTADATRRRVTRPPRDSNTSARGAKAIFAMGRKERLSRPSFAALIR